jgi:hypothetical protein
MGDIIGPFSQIPNAQKATSYEKDEYAHEGREQTSRLPD